MSFFDWLFGRNKIPGEFEMKKYCDGPWVSYRVTWRFENSFFAFSSSEKKRAWSIVKAHAEQVVAYKRKQSNASVST